MVAIIDYDAGNIKSVEKAVHFLGEDACITRDRREILKADHVILPGVGAFGMAMERLKEYYLPEVIDQVISEGVPFLGICLGLQLLYESSEESPGVEGLSVLKGSVKRIPEGNGRKIPHMGWSSLDLKGEGRLFKGVPDETFVYFVHSFYLQAEEEATVKATCDYNTLIHASVEKGNVFGCQFHPEKSSEAGLKILNNFLSI